MSDPALALGGAPPSFRRSLTSWLHRGAKQAGARGACRLRRHPAPTTLWRTVSTRLSIRPVPSAPACRRHGVSRDVQHHDQTVASAIVSAILHDVDMPKTACHPAAWISTNSRSKNRSTTCIRCETASLPPPIKSPT